MLDLQEVHLLALIELYQPAGRQCSNCAIEHSLDQKKWQLTTRVNSLRTSVAYGPQQQLKARYMQVCRATRSSTLWFRICPEPTHACMYVCMRMPVLANPSLPAADPKVLHARAGYRCRRNVYCMGGSRAPGLRRAFLRSADHQVVSLGHSPGIAIVSSH